MDPLNVFDEPLVIYFVIQSKIIAAASQTRSNP
jgi:hypothetical protein